MFRKWLKRKYLLIILPIVVLPIVIFIVLVGRIRYSPWETIPENAPLCAVGKTAVTKKRVCHPPIFVIAVERTEYGWDIGDRVLMQESIVRKIDKYLKRTGFVKKQESLEAYINDVQQHIAPYRFFIVSLEPLIVVMTPYDYGKTKGKSNVELRSKLSDQILSYSSYLVNGYHYGSSVPKSTSYKCFSPQYTKGTQEVTKDGQVFTIQTKTATLVFGDTKKNGWYLITRQ